ncbi:fused MFS/spermidine synthase [Achromobacter xylosoxidans]|uniref:fused MFS/spermidine synthase n=1 Tax=Alcaligenes xylosoxydans xylosoxydans TaxID=85698 RepID=UPI0006C0FE93|nr:spermidine synthase [Achromobacter xylosoxidans]CUK22873.1 spermidine synthase [Achromobacter xylosoxidans]
MYRALIAFLFFISGFSALSYQVVWQRVLTQEVGVDSVSIAFIVAIFLFGIGAGSYAHRYIGALTLARKRQLYVSIEVGIGVFGLVSVDLLRMLNQAAPFGSGIGGQFALNLALLFVPTFLMGLTTPVILDLMRARDDNAGRTVGHLYGVNVLGAACGAIVTGLALIELLGLRGVSQVAAVANLLLAVLFWLALRGVDGPGAAARHTNARGHGVFVLVSLMFGYASMALQMAYFRTAFNHFQIYSFIFPFMLGMFLLSMAIGQFIFGQLADRARNRGLVLSVSALLFVGTLVLAYNLPIDWIQPLSLDDYGRMFALFAAVYAVPVAIGSGMFTLVVRYSTSSGGEVGSQFGKMMAAVSVGNVLGAFTAPLFLFQAIGTMGTLALAMAIYVVGAAVVSAKISPAKQWNISAVVALALIILLPQNFFDRNRMFGNDAPSTLTIEDDVGIVSAFEYEDGKNLSIQVFRSPTSTIFRGEEKGYDMGPLNTLISTDQAEMLVIGLGGANYLPSLVANPRIAHITIVELSPTVAREVHNQGTPSIKAAMESPKVTVVVGDGRRYLQQARRSGRKFDIVQNGIFQPWMSGAGNLYSTEIAHIIRDVLRPGGVYFTLDLELISISAGPAFPYAYSAPPQDRYVYFLASNEPRDFPGLCRRDIRHTERMLTTDDKPVVEYWMLGLLSDSLVDVVRKQIEYYHHPCKSPGR